MEFLAALLTSEMGSIDHIVKFVAECRTHGIAVLQPDINRSIKEFAVDEGQIRFGLVAVKNVGEAAIDAILEARQERPFTSLFDFCERVDLKKVNKRVVESLITCGAFDVTGARRSQMTAALEVALDHGQRVQKERCDPQMGLFGGVDCPEPVNVPALPELDEWDDRLKLSHEKESLGFYLSGHPLTRYEDVLGQFTTSDAISLKEAADGAYVRVGGLVRGTKTIKTKKGDLMAFATIEDMNGAMDVTVFSRVYAAVVDLLVEDRAVLVHGQVQKDEQSVKLVAESIIPLEKAEESWTASVHVSLDLRPGRSGAAPAGCARCSSATRAPARPFCTCAARAARTRWSNCRRACASRRARACGGTWASCSASARWKPGARAWTRPRLRRRTDADTPHPIGCTHEQQRSRGVPGPAGGRQRDPAVARLAGASPQAAGEVHRRRRGVAHSEHDPAGGAAAAGRQPEGRLRRDASARDRPAHAGRRHPERREGSSPSPSAATPHRPSRSRAWTFSGRPGTPSWRCSPPTT